ncbi:unnamed protein product [Paramecium sonneborni]|uniref:Uncharacterized protein n=1 Tax=Paramecium sonneborni TaxID=65129 RepID=A0A8S1NN11_9CILI|nr:unnamed protein product [Paramecium sonneborni]
MTSHVKLTMTLKNYHLLQETYNYQRSQKKQKIQMFRTFHQQIRECALIFLVQIQFYKSDYFQIFKTTPNQQLKESKINLIDRLIFTYRLKNIIPNDMAQNEFINCCHLYIIKYMIFFTYQLQNETINCQILRI